MGRWLGVLACAALACGGEAGTGTSPVRTVRIEPAATLAVGIGDTTRVRALVLDGQGQPVVSARLVWGTSDSAVARVDGGGLLTAVGAGVTDVVARADGVAGYATIEVWIPPVVATWEPGTSYRGRRDYVEYVPGELPLVVSVPHGGDMEPAEIPPRAGGTTVADSWTLETADAVRQAFVERTGRAPHLIVSHLKRTRLDPNREIVEAAEGNPFANNAWREFQAYVDTAVAVVTRDHGAGLYIDLHGHGHDVLRAELGYLLGAAALALPDSALDAGGYATESSVRALAEATSAPFSELLRGATSLGGLLGAAGVAAVPSPADPSPGSDPYFTGGYNVERHGSRHPGSAVSGVQIELPNTGVRDTDAHRRAFAQALAGAVDAFLTTHLGFFAALSPPS